MEPGSNQETNSYADRGDERIEKNDPGGFSSTITYCSICLEAVTLGGDRSFAKLCCGHEFHLDCIGSAFNVKGVMECPNCRKMEDGQWLYANGRSFFDISLEDLSRGEDLLELRSYAEMSAGGRWCPYRNLTSIHPPYEERDFQTSAYQGLVSSTSRPSPYAAYPRPIYHHYSSPSSSSVNSHLHGIHFSRQNRNSHGINPTNLRNQNLELPWHRRRPPDLAPSAHFPFSSTSSLDRSASGEGPSLIPPEYQESNARTRSRIDAHQAYYLQQPGNRRGDGYRGYPLPAESSSELNDLFHAPRRSFPESGNVSVHPWYRDGENMCACERETAQPLTIHSEQSSVWSNVQRQGTERAFWS